MLALNGGEAALFLYTYLLSLLPSFEARYAVIAGRVMGLGVVEAVAASALGVVTLSLVLPLALPFIDRLAVAMAASRYGFLRFLGSLYQRYVLGLRARASRYTERYGFVGLVVFVALPLPGTGIWTGSLAAFLLGLEKRRAMTALAIGGLLSMAITVSPMLLAERLAG